MQKTLLLLFIFLLVKPCYSKQSESKSTDDDFLKEQIYNTNSKVVVTDSMKDFYSLFFEFSDKKNYTKILLTVEQFCGYTIKIAACSDRLAKLYPKERVVARESKKR